MTTIKAVAGVAREVFDALGIEPDTPLNELSGDQLTDVYIELTQLKRDAEERLDRVKATLSELEPSVVEYFTEAGQQSVTRRGMTTYLASETWPKSSGSHEISWLSSSDWTSNPGQPSSPMWR